MKDYTMLDESYDEQAKLFATLVRLHIKTKEKLHELHQKVLQANERLNLYIRNAFWDKFNTMKYSTIIDDGKIFFYNLKKVSALKIKFNEEQLDKDEYFNNLFNQQYMEQVMYFDELFDDEEEDYNENKLFVEFLRKELGEPLFTSPITKQQHQTINGLTDKCYSAEDKRMFAKNQLDDMQEDYAQFLCDIVTKLAEDENYDFDPECDELMTVKDSQTKSWNIIYYTLDTKKEAV